MEAEERPTKRRRLSQDELSAVAICEKGIQETTRPSPTTRVNENGVNHPIRQTDVLENSISAKDDGSQLSPEVNGDARSDQNPADGLPPPTETAPLADSINGDQDDPPLSKSQQKKLRKKLEWESKRDERKTIRKQKMVAKRERRRAEKKAHAAETNSDQAMLPPIPKPKLSKAVTLPVTILFDCDFDDLMLDKERVSLAAQITRSYSDNKNSMFRAHLAVCSFGGKLRERFENVLTHYKSWRGVRFFDCDFVEAAEKAREWMGDEETGGKLAGTFSKLVDNDEEEEVKARLQEQGEIVYLTSEADDTLTELQPYSTYIIGGLVDKNREKGICYNRATKRRIKTARLPIGEFMEMQSRKVLATNHVNEIMLKWLELGDWGQAFLRVIPKRKGGRLKGVERGEDVEVDVDGGGVDVVHEDEDVDGGGGDLVHEEEGVDVGGVDVVHEEEDVDDIGVDGDQEQELGTQEGANEGADI